MPIKNKFFKFIFKISEFLPFMYIVLVTYMYIVLITYMYVIEILKYDYLIKYK